MTEVDGTADRGSSAAPALGTLRRPVLWRREREGAIDRAGLARGCERALDLAVVLLATWTVVYHVCLLLRLSATCAVGLELSTLAAVGLLSMRARRRHPADPSRTPAVSESVWIRSAGTGSSTVESALVRTTVVTGVLAALLVAVDASWPAAAGMWLAAAVAGTVWAALRLRRAPGPDPAEPGPDDAGARHPTAVVPALAWATVLAVLSSLTVWPNPDDLYYVNLSQWVAEHGTFPLRDTIFSNLVYPMSSWPPVASYDALAGTLAWLSGVHAASVVYLWVPPVATFLSVLALWRLLRAWHVEAVGVALSVSLIFLLFDGGHGYASPGNLFLIRIWQGKVILLTLMIPLLLVYALRYVERPSRRHAGWLFLGGVAAVGLSTSAMFLVPLLAVGGMAPLCRRRPGQALGGFVAMAGYPLATGAVTVAVGGRSADLFGSRELFRFDPSWFGHEIFRQGPLAAIAVAAVLLGTLLVRHRAARVTTGVLTVITGVTFVPGVTRLAYDLIGLGPTLWRVSWIASIAALVGVLAAWTAATPARRRIRLAGPPALVLAIVLFGVPIWSERNGVTVGASPQWKRGSQSIDSAQRAIDAARPGDLILAPEELAITIDVVTTRVKTVAPRDYFMDYLRDDPSFQYGQRLTLVNFSNRLLDRADKPAVARALTRLDVDEVCLPSWSSRRIRFVRTLGYRPVPSSAWDRCLRR